MGSPQQKQSRQQKSLQYQKTNQKYMGLMMETKL